MRNAILLVGQGRRPLYANQAFLDMSGYEYEEWMSLNQAWAITPQHDQVETGKTLNRVLGGETSAFRLRSIVRKDGSEVWVEACATPLPIGNERIICAEFRPPYVELPEGAVAWQPTRL